MFHQGAGCSLLYQGEAFGCGGVLGCWSHDIFSHLRDIICPDCPALLSDQFCKIHHPEGISFSASGWSVLLQEASSYISHVSVWMNAELIVGMYGAEVLMNFRTQELMSDISRMSA